MIYFIGFILFCAFMSRSFSLAGDWMRKHKVGKYRKYKYRYRY